MLIAWVGPEDERGVVYEAGVSRLWRGGEGVRVDGSYYRRDEIPAESLSEEGPNVGVSDGVAAAFVRFACDGDPPQDDVLHRPNGRVTPRSTSPHR